MLNMLMNLMSSLLNIICVLVGVALLTMLERKVLGSIQIRKGYIKVGFSSIMLKVFIKTDNNFSTWYQKLRYTNNLEQMIASYSLTHFKMWSNDVFDIKNGKMSNCLLPKL